VTVDQIDEGVRRLADAVHSVSGEPAAV
jgi:hypothetical protein